MPDNPPIKRSKELAPLSREHHEGLLFVWKLKQGIQKGIEPARIAGFAQWFWSEHLQAHFKKEEEVLSPILGKSMKLREQLFDEHAAIKKILEEAIQHPSHIMLESLANTVNDHIRFEERVLFKHIEVTVTAEELHAIGLQLADDKKSAAVWEDEFWVRAK